MQVPMAPPNPETHGGTLQPCDDNDPDDIPGNLTETFSFHPYGIYRRARSAWEDLG